MDKASRLDAAELLHDALDGRRHLAQLVDVRVAQIINVSICDDDPLLARVLRNPRDALAPL